MPENPAEKYLFEEIVMDSISAVGSANLTMQVQATMQRKLLDHRAENFLLLLEGINQASEKIRGEHDSGLGKIVDVFA